MDVLDWLYRVCALLALILSVDKLEGIRCELRELRRPQ